MTLGTSLPAQKANFGEIVLLPKTRLGPKSMNNNGLS